MCRRPARQVGMSRPKKTKFNPVEELQSTKIGPDAAKIDARMDVVGG